MRVRLNLREWREMRGLTQADLAKVARVRQATISELETGSAKSVSFAVLERLARSLDVHPSQLFTDQRSR
jgi:transcriptional regulator with XRE-family HTH domain